jgi:hypothetical protein
MFEHVSAQDKVLCYKLRCDILSKPEDSNVFTAKIAISDKYIFRLSRYLNHYNARTWGSKNQCALIAGTVPHSLSFVLFP